MNHSIAGYLVALGLLFTPACGDDDGGGGESIPVSCQKACATAASLSCPNEDVAACRSDCEQAGALPMCQAEARAAVRCAAARPASDWECDEDGEAELKDGICEEEGEVLFSCVFGDNEDGTCPFENDGECDDPTGTDICPAGTDVADCT